MICNCESGYCAHHHGDPADIMDARPCRNKADGTVRMEYVGDVCQACAAVTERTAPQYIHRATDSPEIGTPG